jgi:hypothetical protein
MHSDALCHEFDTHIGGNTEFRFEEGVIVANVPFARRTVVSRLDKGIEQQHGLAMQDKFRRRHAA